LQLKKNTPRAKEFRLFVGQGGEDLRQAALYAALDEYFKSQHSALWGWPVWPESYRDLHSAEVEKFAVSHADRVQFYQYLQWQAEIQLRAAIERAKQLQMPMGLYCDLALGVNSSGAEAWSNQKRYAFKASAGAPPDLLNVKGQVWGLPPLIPHRLREAAYEPFIKALRFNMSFSSALRIDHIMCLMRIFWVPEGCEGGDGTYVRYELDEMIGILALESLRNSCVVIGEDLGTVPNEVRAAMLARGVLSYKVLYFMKDGQGNFMLPRDYPQQALVTASTHDLPTLLGYWFGNDLEVRKSLALFTEHLTYESELAGREADRERLLAAFKAAGLIKKDADFGPAQANTPIQRQLCDLGHCFLASTPCLLQSVQLEDLLLQREQMNLPGTTKEHPNWKRRLSVSLEDIAVDKFVLKCGKRISQARKHI
jgi:(1->4)-alpha-D-glucan 1-alpha-D-glucosylmutase